ncbi:NAD-dependent epimerase/dehydratase family protein [Paenibacillus sp. HJGM_3]|uniref:NAD-dependent epimerase/dehydratase family protein n=1 Tax=Paenibacillus sp. HJGM_3 TaxID=3379816 RepID=UPI00385B2DB9
MKILVTGGAGFIASNIVDELISLGHSVAVLDNLSSGHKAFINPQAHLLQADIDDSKIGTYIKEFRPELLIHHAAQIDVQNSMLDSVHDARVNILGTLNVLECCKNYIRKVVYASSAAVYGVPKYIPIDEAHPINPISNYGISKYTPESYLRVYSERFGIPYTILRYGNVFGIRQDPNGEGGVVSVFLDKLLNGHRPIIYGDGENTRDFIFVKDVVKANIQSLYTGDNRVLNISCGKQTSVNQLLAEMCSILNVPFNPIYQPNRPGDIIHSCLDNTLAKQILDWEPEFSIKEGVKQTINYYLNQKIEAVGQG